MKNSILVFILFIIFSSCGTGNGSKSSALLPDSTGGADELMVFINDEFFEDTLSKKIKKTLVEPYKLLPQSEARFTVTSVPYSKVNMILQRFINPIFIVVQNEKSALVSDVKSILTEEEFKLAGQKESSIFYKSNIWAKDQNICIIVVKSKDEIISTLEKYKSEINAYYDHSNLKFYKKIAYIDGVNKSLKKQLKEFHGIDFDIPNGYVLAKNEKNLVLLRKDDAKITRFLAFDLVEYNAEIPINNLGIKKFDEIGKIIDGEEKESYVVADTTLGFKLEKIEEDGLVKFENAGLWVMANDLVGGGPFVNQYIIDNSKNRVIYLSGLIYGPGEKKKKKYMRQFEVIFSTLKTK